MKTAPALMRDQPMTAGVKRGRWRSAFLLIRWRFSTTWDRHSWQRSVGAALLLILGAAGGAAGGPGRDLRNLPASQEVVAVTLCHGQYDVVLKDGSHRQFAEYSLVFKMDTSEFGPPAAALVVSSRSPWRAAIVLPNPQALMEVLYRRC